MTVVRKDAKFAQFEGHIFLARVLYPSPMEEFFDLTWDALLLQLT